MNRFYLLMTPLVAAVVLIMGQYASAQSTVCSVQGPDEKITVKTDKKTYVTGEAVLLTGKVHPVVAGENVRLDVYDAKNQSFISDANLYLNEEGTFTSQRETGYIVYNVLPLQSYTVKNLGEYTAQVTYNGQSVETSFTVKATR